eukprot:1592121-Amphidinium_carterae.1
MSGISLIPQAPLPGAFAFLPVRACLLEVLFKSGNGGHKGSPRGRSYGRALHACTMIERQQYMLVTKTICTTLL